MVRISSKDNPLIKHIIKLNKSSKYRRVNGEFIAEGLRVCRDAALSDAKISALIITDSAQDKYAEDTALLSDKADKTYVVSESVFEHICDTKSPQGVLCIIKTLDNPFLFGKIKSNGKFLALDNIQDPSNLGTILRTAEAIGIDGIIMSADTCDIYSPKVVRGSMGAVFRVPYTVVSSIAEFLSEHKELNSYAAVVDSDAYSVTEIGFTEPCVAVIGNEGNGLKPETVESCDKKITIPMKGRAESLNASIAAGIIIWEMVK